MKKHCKGVPFWYPLQTDGGIQKHRLLTESDVMRLITASKMPAAVEFERWVFDDVLPAIRSTGVYVAPGTYLIRAAAEPGGTGGVPVPVGVRASLIGIAGP